MENSPLFSATPRFDGLDEAFDRLDQRFRFVEGQPAEMRDRLNRFEETVSSKWDVERILRRIAELESRAHVSLKS